jgi:hypothetical protein
MRIAQLVSDPENRSCLVVMAQKWRDLADFAERAEPEKTNT